MSSNAGRNLKPDFYDEVIIIFISFFDLSLILIGFFASNFNDSFKDHLSFVGQFQLFKPHKSKEGSWVMTPRTTLRFGTAR